MVADPAHRDRILDLMRPFTAPDMLARGLAVYRRLDELAGRVLAGETDPYTAAAELVAGL